MAEHHPFDTNELAAIRGVCAAGLLTVDYAAAVMPLMADKIETLRALLAQTRQDLDAVMRTNVQGQAMAQDLRERATRLHRHFRRVRP